MLAGVEMVGNRNAQRERRGILNRAMDNTQRTQQSAIDQTLAEAESLRPDARMQALTDQEGQIAAQLGKDVAGAVSPAPAGARPDAYGRALMTSDAGEADRTSAIVRELSRVRGVGNLQQNEALRRSSMAEALQSMWSSANNRTRAAEMDAGAVMPPWWAQVAGIGNRLGQSAGRAMTGGMM